MFPFRNLVFEGGGVKGIAYVGALEVLEQRGILAKVQRIGGTSAGAINAVLLALGYSGAETLKILKKMDFNNFLDDSWGVARDTHRLVTAYGWYKGDYFRDWMGQLVAAKMGSPHATFNDVKLRTGKDLYLVGTNLSTAASEVFSIEHTPRERVVDAVRISMSIPLFFTAVRNGIRGDLFVDGGVINNFPIKLFDRAKYLPPERLATHGRETAYYKAQGKTLPPTSSPYLYNKETLGFRLDGQQEIARYRDGAEPPQVAIDDFFDYAKALVRTLLSAQDNLHLHRDDWHRTVFIDTLDVGTVDFDVSAAKKQSLVAQGRKGTEAYLRWYANPGNGEPPLNAV
jgi:NTE family protein